jgi:GNAT superfamily N-acetyltransferase
MKLRAYEIGDLPQVAQLFHDTVHQVNLGAYTRQQVDAWAPARIDLEHWGQKLVAQEVIVAERHGAIVGFCSWNAGGCLDFLYVHHVFQRQGIASALFAAAEKSLRAGKHKYVYTHASITAELFFLRQGFRIVKRQVVAVRGVEMPNAVMEKLLD